MVELSIVIPAYNEERRIERTVNEYLKFFDMNLSEKYEIVIIPNNCSDSTVGIVSRLAKRCRGIRFKNIDEAIGKSGAVVEGFKLAKGHLIGFVDADNSAPPESLFKLIQEIGEFDGAIGSRWKKDSEIELKQPLSRRFFSRSFNLLIRFFLNLKYYDTQCGCKVFKKEKIKKIIPNLSKAKWAFDVDLLYQLKRADAKVVEIPVRWADNPRTHLNLKSAPPQMLLALLRLRLLHSPLRVLVRFYDKLPQKWKNLI